MMRNRQGSFSLGALLAACLLALAGCGGGGAANSVPAQSGDGEEAVGALEIALTDAEGDFAHYRVRVGSVRFVRADGATTEVPLDLAVDFTELVDLSEVVTVATLPAGRYRDLSLELDFTHAEVVLQNPDGSLVAAQLEDADGRTPGLFEVAIELAAGGELDIPAGGARRLTLDFDLALSNSRDEVLSERVRVDPLVFALPAHEAGRPHRVRGLLRAVDLEAAVVGLDLQPFGHPVAGSGAVRFRVDEETHYLIDGAPFRGRAGLEALAAQTPGAPVAAAGTVVADAALLAQRVLVGESVPGSGGDSVRGVVLAREGDRLILGGAVVERPAVAQRFEQRVVFVVGAGTRVALPGSETIAGAEVLSVGSRLQAFGEIAVNEEGVAVLDASDGRVQLLATGLTGAVRSVEPLAVDLHLLAGRRPGAFDFSGTGATAAEDSDPAAYLLRSIQPLGFTAQPGQLLRARGRVQDFGVAPPDFLASAVVEAGAGPRRALLEARWPRPGTRTAFLGIGADAFGLDLGEARVQLRIAGVERDLLPADGRIRVVAAEVDSPTFVISILGQTGQRQYRDFADLTTALLELEASGRALARFGAHGRYNPTEAMFEAERLQVVFTPVQVP